MESSDRPARVNPLTCPVSEQCDFTEHTVSMLASGKYDRRFIERPLMAKLLEYNGQTFHQLKRQYSAIKKSPFPCHNCGFYFDSAPIMIPARRVDGVFEKAGNYCCGGCGNNAVHMRYHGEERQLIVLLLLNDLRENYGFKGSALGRVPFMTERVEFGGNLTAAGFEKLRRATRLTITETAAPFIPTSAALLALIHPQPDVVDFLKSTRDADDLAQRYSQYVFDHLEELNTEQDAERGVTDGNDDESDAARRERRRCAYDVIDPMLGTGQYKNTMRAVMDQDLIDLRQPSRERIEEHLANAPVMPKVREGLYEQYLRENPKIDPEIETYFKSSMSSAKTSKVARATQDAAAASEVDTPEHPDTQVCETRSKREGRKAKTPRSSALPDVATKKRK